MIRIGVRGQMSWPASDEKETMSSSQKRRNAGYLLGCVGIGVFAGFLSGLFGVGGGVVIVPLLVLLLGFDQRLAAGTSLAAIAPTAAVGTISYALHGAVAWIPALLIAGGAIVGAQLGTWLLSRVSQAAVRWAFLAFLAVVIAALFMVVPSRQAELDLTWITVLVLIVLGVVTGTVSGLIGVGGGVIVVPALMLGFGTSDLIAKGTSLLMMVPAALSGTLGNLRRRNVDLLAAAVVGVAACAMTVVGAWLATLIDPLVGNILFAAFLVFIGIQLAVKAVPGRSR